MEKFNPRFVEYCRLTGGLSAEETLKRDAETYPGGLMCGFILWLGDRWKEWSREFHDVDYVEIKSEAHHAHFDTWLANK